MMSEVKDQPDDFLPSRLCNTLVQRVQEGVDRLIKYVLKEQEGIVVDDTDYEGSRAIAERIQRCRSEIWGPNYEEFWLDSYGENGGKFLASIEYLYGDDMLVNPMEGLKISMSFNYQTNLPGEVPESILKP